MNELLIGLGLIIIAVLAVVAWTMQQKVKAQERRQEQRSKDAASIKENTRQSIRLLADGVLNEQLTLTEGCIRISALLDSLYTDPADKQPFEPIYQLADKTRDIPRLSAWQALSKQEKMDFDIKRVNEEQLFSHDVKRVAQVLGGCPK
ncbi:DUF2489 domain-containing protein, partial [bacterium]|nr:DUF2489 domain-containing protein [bacterium]